MGERSAKFHPHAQRPSAAKVALIVWELVFEGRVREEPQVVEDMPALGAAIGDCYQEVPERLFGVEQRRPGLWGSHAQGSSAEPRSPAVKT